MPTLSDAEAHARSMKMIESIDAIIDQFIPSNDATAAVPHALRAQMAEKIDGYLQEQHFPPGEAEILALIERSSTQLRQRS